MTYRSQTLVGAKAVSQGKAVISLLGYEQHEIKSRVESTYYL